MKRMLLLALILTGCTAGPGDAPTRLADRPTPTAPAPLAAAPTPPPAGPP